MKDRTNTTGTSPTLPEERPGDVAATLLAAHLDPAALERLEALRHRSTELLRIFGPQLLSLVEEMRHVEDAVNAAFGTAPKDWCYRFEGTGLDHAQGVLGVFEDLAGERYQPGELGAVIEDMTAQLAERAAGS